MKKYLLTLFLVILCKAFMVAQVTYTARDVVKEYKGYFRPGINFDYYPPYNNKQLANISAGNPALGLTGIGARAFRPALRESFVAVWGYDHLVDDFVHMKNLGMDDVTMIVGFATDEHRLQQQFCDGADPQHIFCANDPYNPDCRSDLFENMYTPIWDGGANGTPYNDDNYLAAYMYKLVTTYKDDVKFWEIWNEPGFDHSYIQGWQQPGGPNNWWDEDPSPCVNHFHAPIEYFVRTLRICYDVVKTVDPDAYVCLAGVGFESFLDAVLRNTDNPVDGSVTAEYPYGGGAYFDCMGFHTYPDIDGSVRYWDNATNSWVYSRHSDAAAEGVNTRKHTYENRLALYGFDGVTYPKKEWIITEINSPRKKFDPNSMASIESQVNYITKATVNAMKLGVRQMHPFQLADRKVESAATGEFDLLGMYKNFTNTQPYDALQKTDEGIAYTTTSKFVYKTKYDAAKTAAMNLPSNLDGIALLDEANQRYKYILWAKTTIDLSEAASGTYSFPASFGITTLTRTEWDYSNTFQSTTVGPNNIALTGRPIYLMEPSTVTSTLSATCPNDTTIIGTAEGVTVNWDLPTGTTSCPVQNLNFLQTTGPLPGTTTTWPVVDTITYLITDDCDNSTTCQFVVTGVMQAPSIDVACPNDIVVTIPAGETSAQVSWNESDVVVTTNCGTPSTSQLSGPSSGSDFPVGTTQIQYLGLSTSCQGGMTLTASCTFNVIVNVEGGGTSILTVDCPSNVTIVGSDSEVTLNWDEPTASTTCANPNVTITQTAGPNQGTTYTQAVTETVTYSISDSCGNVSTCSFDVIGELQVATPEISITCPPDIKITVPATDTGSVASWNESDIFATSNCATPSVQQIVGLPNGSFFPVGLSLIKYLGVANCNGTTITDVCQFSVTVQKEAVANTEINTFAKFTLFPNPTADVALLDVEAEQGRDIHVEVIDYLGRVVLTKKYPFTSGQLNTKLDLHTFANGTYLVKVSTDNQVGVKRITVEK